MKQKTFKSLFFAAALTAFSASVVFADSCSTSCDTACEKECADCCSGYQQSQGLWQPHSLGVSMSREIFLTKPAFVDMANNEGWYGTFGAAFEYNQNFGEEDCCEKNCDSCKSLGSLPFWAADKSNQMTVGDANGDYDLDLYQIGLGEVTTNGTITLNPKVYQTGAHFLLYFGSRKEERGFFATIGGPVGVISVDPRLCVAGDIEAGVYTQGVFNAAAENVTAPYSTVEEAFAGGKDAGFYKGLKFAKISSCKRSSSAKFGDLAFAVGYNFLADEKKHMGIAARFSAPTGNTACAEYVFDPIFGRNDHWGAGAQVMGHFKVWEANESDKSLNIWLNATVEHLFRSNHQRTFDLESNGLGSKYLLLAKYNGTTFQNEIVNAANVSTIDIESSFGVEANFAVAFDFNMKNWDMGLTYEGWARSCEKLKVDCSCADAIDLSSYGVLGRQAPYSSADGTTEVNLGQPNATIGEAAARVDASAGDVVDISLVANRLNSDVNEALNICGQRAGSAYTSKIVAHGGYTWKDSDYAPYLGLSGGAEFTHKDNSAVRFWNVGVRGGMAF